LGARVPSVTTVDWLFKRTELSAICQPLFTRNLGVLSDVLVICSITLKFHAFFPHEIPVNLECHGWT